MGIVRTNVTLGEDGLIHNGNLEIMAAHGCNLTCRSCTHASPVLRPKDIADPETTARDLSRLARCYRANRVKLLGGEPLLHPDLVALADAVREAARPAPPPRPEEHDSLPGHQTGRRGHLRVIPPTH